MISKLEETIAGRRLTIETGRMAKQADGAALVRYGDSAVLVASTSEREPKDLPFFPLTIEYRERTYAAGKIPGGFFKREGRPQEKEVLTARLIDRPLRPLFPEGYMFETQVYCLALSSDGENDPALLAMVGASASLMISDIPWDGPVSPVKIGRVDGELIVNPKSSDLERSDMDLVVSVKGGEVVMMEGFCSEVPEDVVLEAVELAVSDASKINSMQMELVNMAGKEKRPFESPTPRDGLLDSVAGLVAEELDRVYGSADKNAMSEALSSAKERAVVELHDQYDVQPDEEEDWSGEVSEAASKAEKEYVREKLLKDTQRPDGRKPEQIREVTCEVGVLPRTHGSALFTRGETQALVAATLGGSRDEQRIDALLGEYHKCFILHYNFPSFSVGEVRRARGPGRREIGHGYLAESALRPVMPEDFNYTVRVVSDILESNGSSSQATVCGGSLCLMDAGVPTSTAIAGIAIGLVTDGSRHVILSDIAGVEDHLGDMDLKVAGSKSGVTAIQMDLKVEGISREVLREALDLARRDRLSVLEIMNRAISEPRAELSPYAPRIDSITIDRDKIGMLIGPGGKNIRAITEETGADIDIDDDGTVLIMTTDAAAAEKTKQMIDQSIGNVKEGEIYEGTVVNIMNFGAFVEIIPGIDGLLHVSQISERRIKHPGDVFDRGDRVRVKVRKVRDDGKIDLTMRDVGQEDLEKND
ncbi:polyribonucleotide nucleotidyltransferase [Candidatus Fermentibacteria bacterium]|nr:polyribonucleotide nucleotidyltransferase [Candidatus Fermentibacteria bacterium]